MENSVPVKKFWLWWLVIVAMTVVLRWPSFFGGFINIDENEYAIASSKILAGGLPYKDFLIYQPPVIYYFYALSFKIFGSQDLRFVHFLLLAVVLASAFFIYLAATKLFNSKNTGMLAAFFYAFLSVVFVPQDMLAANCEILAVLPTLAAIWCYFKGAEKDNHLFYLFSGFAISIAFLTKYQCGIVLLPILFGALFIKRNAASIITILAGFFLPIVIIVFMLQYAGAGNAAREAFLYITSYAKGPVQADFWYVLMKFIVRTFLFVLAGTGVWYLAIKGIFAGLQNKVFLIIWLFVSFIPVILGGRMYFHYYFTVIPVICIIAAATYYSCGLNKWLKLAFVLWGVINAVGFFMYDIHKPHRKLTVKDEWIYVVEYLKKNAGADDSLFVWGYSPQIYVGSGLTAATRFTTADYLTGRTPMTAGLEYDPQSPDPPSSLKKLINDFVDPPGVVIFGTSNNIFPKAWDYLKEDFEKKLPTYIIDTAPSNYRRYGRYPIEKYPYLNGILSAKYSLEEEIKGYRIYRIKN